MDEIDFKKSIETLKDLTEIQCSEGNWNYDEYMHGMANGMIFALSLFEDGGPKYLGAPDRFIANKTFLQKMRQLFFGSPKPTPTLEN